MKTLLLILSILSLYSCSGNTQNSINNPQEEANSSDINSNNTDIAKKSKSFDELFALWEQKLIDNQIFDYVTESDCENNDMMMELYEKDKYPMHTASKSFVEFDYNNDGIKDYVVNYTLMNCVRGNGWSSDILFMTSKDGQLDIDENLTNILKQKYYDYVSTNYGEDMYVYYDKKFLVVKTLEINRVIDDECLGTFSISQGITGHFSFNLKDNDFKVYNVE